MFCRWYFFVRALTLTYPWPVCQSCSLAACNDIPATSEVTYQWPLKYKARVVAFLISGSADFSQRVFKAARLSWRPLLGLEAPPAPAPLTARFARPAPSTSSTIPQALSTTRTQPAPIHANFLQEVHAGCKSGICRSSAFCQFDSHNFCLGIASAKLLAISLGGFLAENSRDMIALNGHVKIWRRFVKMPPKAVSLAEGVLGVRLNWHSNARWRELASNNLSWCNSRFGICLATFVIWFDLYWQSVSGASPLQHAIGQRSLWSSSVEHSLGAMSFSPCGGSDSGYIAIRGFLCCIDCACCLPDNHGCSSADREWDACTRVKRA